MIVTELEAVMADRKISLNDLSQRVGITNVNLSRIKTGKVKSLRFSTLDGLCRELECQPGDLIKYKKDC